MDIHVPASTSRFFGEVERSKKGTYPVLRYPIPGGSLCYVFVFSNVRKGGVSYRCRECKMRGRSTTIQVKRNCNPHHAHPHSIVFQVVNGNQFVRDPALIPHACLPLKNAHEKVTHILYKEYKNIRNDPVQASRRPRQLWQELANSVDNIAVHDEALRDDMTRFFHKEGYKSRRSTFSQAHRVTMDNVPRQFAFLPDGSRFLQYSSSTLHIYFSEQILEKACQLGLCALVADGVHDLQPQATNKMGQLYTIHGVMANSVDVPLLFAITTRKTQAVYESVFGALKNAVVACAGPERLRIVLDYEKAAIAAVKKTFPSGSVEGLLGILLGVKYPRMSDLILTLQGCVTTARGALLSAERRRTQRKRLNKRDILRRRRIEKEMARFKLILHRDRAFLRTVTITTYCRRMSRFLTEKVV
ncbi:MULE domain-containing protein [Trichostrongylus colubriformis]|uniref:MULE domain-containing protein n=1 Tax=Trichostrongylus colubriformis TaxID=6319 RepID=A0AAN8IIA2_TRICO